MVSNISRNAILSPLLDYQQNKNGRKIILLLNIRSEKNARTNRSDPISIILT